MKKSVRHEGHVLSHDGLRLYYTSHGSGPTVILCSGLSVSFVYWKYLVPELAKRFRVIQWNYRGHGRSESPVRRSHATIAHLVRDLEALRSGLGIRRCALLGHSMGVQVILEYYRQYPQHVTALIPAFGTFARPFDTAFDSPRAYTIFRLLYWMARFRHPAVTLGWNFVHKNPLKINFHLVRSLGVVHPKKCAWDDFASFFEHYKRLEMNVCFELARSAQRHSAADVLARIKVPTLVMGALCDRFTPVMLSRQMADSIEGCEYLEIPDASHAAFLEEPDLINRRVREFLNGALKGRRR